MATITLPTGTGTQQWTPPANCHVLDKIELWGPGGSGGKRTGARVTGGGAGAYNVINGPIIVSSLLVAGTVPFQTGRGGAAQATANTAGNPGTAKTWFSAIGTYAADFGLGGLATGTGTTAGGAGGLVANCVPTTNAKAGGNGGTDSSVSGASGGGASPSSNGAGVSAAAVSTGVGGAGATAPTGGGNGGAASITTSNATSGSSPGGGGGAHNGATGNSGAGADGQIVLTYTPDPVSSIVIGVANWQSSTSYTSGVLSQNSTNAYLCITSGTSASSGGPATTASDITDGTVHWKYLCHVDYTSLSSWASGIPGTPTLPIVGQVLASGPILMPAGSTYLSLSGHSTTPTNTITVTPFPGYSIGSVLAANISSVGSPFSSDFSLYFGSGQAQTPLALSTTAAICFVAPALGGDAFSSGFSSGFGSAVAGNINYFDITDANVVFDGLQIQGNSPTDLCSLLKTETGASNFVLRNCILDGYGQASGASIIDTNDQALVYNNLIIDRQAAVNTSPTTVLNGGNGSHFVNNTLIKFNGESAGATTAISWSTTTGSVFRNNAVYGYANPFGSGVGGSATADHNVSSASTFVSSGLTVGAGNVTGTLAANQFINPISDWRIITGAACVRAGIADPTDIPSSTDIAGHLRVEWDAGVWSLYVAAFTASSPLQLIAIGSASQVTTDLVSAAVNIFVQSVVVTLGRALNASAAVSIARLSQNISVSQGNTVSSITSIFSAIMLDSSKTGSDIILSGSNLAAAKTIDGVNAFEISKSTISVGSGKYYFELKMTLMPVSGFSGVGLCNALMAVNVYGGGSTNAIVWLCNGSVQQNSGVVTNINGTNPNEIVAMAFDVTRGLLWVKNITESSFWNNSGGADPVAGTGGITIGVAGPLFVMAALHTNDALSLNFGQSAFTGSVPAGFSLIPSGLAVSSSAIINIQASCAVGVATLSCLGFLNDVAAGKASVPTIVCVAGITQNYTDGNVFLLATFASMVAVANMTAATTASGSSNADLGSLIRAGQEEQASATVSFGTMLATGVAAQFDIVSAVSVSLPAIVCVAAISISCSLRVRLLAMAATATMTLAGQAVGRAGLLTITIPTPVQTQLRADPSILLLADGSGLILSADVPRPVTVTETTNLSSTSTLPPLVASVLAFESDVATSTRNIMTMVAVSTAGQADLAIGSASVVLGVSSQAVQQRSSNTLDTLASLQAVVAAGQSDTATGTGTLSLVAVGAAQQVDQAHSATNVNLAVVANGGPTLIWSGTVSLPPLTAVITMANVNGAHGSASMVLAVAGALTSSTNASAADAVATMAVAASALLTTPATASVAIPALVAVATLGQSDSASGIAAVVLAGGGVLNNASVSAATLATLPPLVAAGTAQNFILSASALASIRLGVAATASLNGAQMAGTGTITISAVSATGHANLAATLASLAVLAETNATLYVSPIAYETGQDVIFWSA